jgi:leucyl/phenylalanyl-tRNA--protein transferase
MPRYSPPNFPPATSADEYGVVLVGGKLTPEWVLAAYRQGIFPWPVSMSPQRHVLAWFSPDPRAVLEFSHVYISQRLARRMKSGQFSVTFNQAFDQVVAACAAPRSYESGTWITPEIKQAYGKLHRAKFAHSVEVWQDAELVGGLYGVALGGYFAGESMFHRVTDASKIALVSMAQHLQTRGFSLFDVQVMTPHLASMGASDMTRTDFLVRMQQAQALDVTF